MRNLLIIGASGGIGHESAKNLLDAGYNVIGTYFQKEDRVKDLLPKLIPHFLDLRDPQSIESLAAFIPKSALPLYAVINCAGICRFEGDSIESDMNIWQETIATNLSGNFYLAKYFSNLLEPNGRFIMISSTDSKYGGTITASYAASKSGVNSLTKSLSLLFQDKQIRVNSVSPGWVITPMIADNGEAFLNQVAQINPLRRNAKPIDIVNVIRFLLTPESDYINGQVIPVEGGYTNQDPTLLIEEQL